MRKIITVAVPFVAALGLVACGGVDREGTRDLIVEQAEAAGATVDSECIDAALEEYSDDELQSIDDAISSNEETEEATALLESLTECLSFEG